MPISTQIWSYTGFNPEAIQQLPPAQPEPIIDDYNTGNMYGSTAIQNIPGQAIESNITPYGATNEGQNDIPLDIPPPDYNTTMANKQQQSNTNMNQPLISSKITADDDYYSYPSKPKRNYSADCCNCNWYVLLRNTQTTETMNCIT